MSLVINRVDLSIGDQEQQLGEPSRDGDKKPERPPHVSLPVVAQANP